MPNLRDIRRRIRSIQNTGKVTKAMEMIAASKLRRTQQAALAARPYSDKILEVIGHLAAQPADEAAGTQPLLERRAVNNIEILHITPDRGLCGGLHGNLNGMVGQFILSAQAPVRLVCVGRKGRDFMVRYGRDVRATFMNIGDRPTLADTLAISHIAIDDYTSGEVDEVYLAYPESVSTISQRPMLKKLLPIEASDCPPPGGWVTSMNPRVLTYWGLCYRASWRCSYTMRCWSLSPVSSRPAWWRCATPATARARWSTT